MRITGLLLSFLVAAFSGMSQNSPVDFEAGGHGASWTWTVFENDTNPSLEIIANPDPSGANTSSTVAKFTALQTGQPWAGCETQHGADIGTFTLTPATSTIRIMVWKSVISDVGIKLVESNSASLGEIKISNTLINQWEEIVFDFSSMEGIAYDQIVVFPDFDLAGRTTDNVCYFDNITFGNITAPAVPLVAAPDPTHAHDDVISLYSDVYTNVSVDTFLTPWSVATLSQIQIGNNPTLLYQSLEFAGIETTGSNLLNIEEMDSVHFDIWSPDFTEFKFKLVDFGADGQYQGGDDVEHELVYSTPAQEQWISYDIPIADFTNLTTKQSIAQIIFSGAPAGSVNLYVDNLYFSKESTDTTTTGLSDRIATAIEVTIFPNPVTNMVQLRANQTINQVIIYDLLGNEVVNETENSIATQIDLSTLSTGIYVIKIDTDSGELTKRLIKR